MGALDFRRAVGSRIRELRRERGLSIEELAHRAGMHRTHLGAIERAEGNPTLDTLIDLARALRVRPAELLDVDLGDRRTLHAAVVGAVGRLDEAALRRVLRLLRALE